MDAEEQETVIDPDAGTNVLPGLAAIGEEEENPEKSVASTADEMGNLSQNAGSKTRRRQKPLSSSSGSSRPSASFSFSASSSSSSSQLDIYEEKLAQWKMCNPASKTVPSTVIDNLTTEAIIAAAGCAGQGRSTRRTRG